MAPPLLHLTGTTLTFGGTPLLTGAELAVGAGERVALVGRNGSGKSTLLKIAAGLVEPDGGTRFLQPGATLRYLPQEPDFTGFATALAYVEAGLGPGDDPYRARRLLEDLGLTGDEDPAAMSGGEARRAALARVLAPDPDLLLLDEPTNHLDLPAIEALEAELRGSRAGLVLISHDRRFLDGLTRRTVWLDRGVTRRLERGFGAFEAWRDEQLEAEETQRHKLDRRIEAENHWLRYGVTARRKRNVGRLRALEGLRTERREGRRATGEVRMGVSEGEGSGTRVIEARGLTKGYGGPPVVRGLSVKINRGDRVGIVGPNGAGKTTLLRLLTGQLAPDEGSVRLGANLDMVTMDQRRDELDPAWTLTEAVTRGAGDSVTVGGATKHVAAYLKDFLFTPEQARTPVSVLSGGERGRLMLARALATPSNLLVLDEPTNDLDLETLDVLQETLADYGGTLLLVSHDRDFLDRVATSVLVAEGEGVWLDYAGGYSDMLAQRGRGVDARGVPAREAAPKAASRAAAPPPSRARLTFNEAHALKTLPARMEALAAEIARHRATLADPALYARDRRGFDAASASLARAEAALANAEEQWLELEMKREALDAGALAKAG